MPTFQEVSVSLSRDNFHPHAHTGDRSCFHKPLFGLILTEPLRALTGVFRAVLLSPFSQSPQLLPSPHSHSIFHGAWELVTPLPWATHLLSTAALKSSPNFSSTLGTPDHGFCMHTPLQSLQPKFPQLSGSRLQ